MSLTNPEKVVTEERLNEYHQTMLPYLGGMPDILANKFSRADLYSTDEKMIGRWIDGKPVYQRTFTFPSRVTLNSNSWYATNFDGSDIEHTISAFVYFDTYGVAFPVYSEISNNKIGLLQTRSAEMAGTGGFVLQYTKTTDSSVEIGVDTDYSTTEKIVGTWIDGKPLYQKTFNYTTATTGSIAITVGTVNNVEFGWVEKGFYINSNSYFALPGSVMNINSTGRNTTEVTYTSYAEFRNASASSLPGAIRVYFGSTTASNGIYITVRYTKTTD